MFQSHNFFEPPAAYWLVRISQIFQNMSSYLRLDIPNNVLYMFSRIWRENNSHEALIIAKTDR